MVVCAIPATNSQVFLGHSVTRPRTSRRNTAQLVDSEIRSLIENAEHTARRILHDHVDELHALAKALLEHETLTGDEVKAVLRGEKVVRENPSDEQTTPRPPSSSVPAAGRPRGEGGLTPEPQPSTRDKS